MNGLSGRPRSLLRLRPPAHGSAPWPVRHTEPPRWRLMRSRPAIGRGSCGAANPAPSGAGFDASGAVSWLGDRACPTVSHAATSTSRRSLRMPAARPLALRKLVPAPRGQQVPFCAPSDMVTQSTPVAARLSTRSMVARPSRFSGRTLRVPSCPSKAKTARMGSTKFFRSRRNDKKVALAVRSCSHS